MYVLHSFVEWHTPTYGHFNVTSSVRTSQDITVCHKQFVICFIFSKLLIVIVGSSEFTRRYFFLLFIMATAFVCMVHSLHLVFV